MEDHGRILHMKRINEKNIAEIVKVKTGQVCQEEEISLLPDSSIEKDCHVTI